MYLLFLRSSIYTQKKLHNLRNDEGVTTNFVLYFGESREFEKKRKETVLNWNCSSLDSENMILKYVSI